MKFLKENYRPYWDLPVFILVFVLILMLNEVL